MKKIVQNIFRLTLFLLVAAGCRQEVGAQSTKAEIKEIDAAYMKANIYDWEKNPGTFVYKGKKPCIIDFYANWCGPCRSLAPKLAEVAEEYAGKVIVYKVNIDNEKQLANIFGVTSIPTLIFVPLKGKPYFSQGNLQKSQLREAIEKIL